METTEASAYTASTESWILSSLRTPPQYQAHPNTPSPSRSPAPTVQSSPRTAIADPAPTHPFYATHPCPILRPSIQVSCVQHEEVSTPVQIYCHGHHILGNSIQGGARSLGTLKQPMLASKASQTPEMPPLSKSVPNDTTITIPSQRRARSRLATCSASIFPAGEFAWFASLLVIIDCVVLAPCWYPSKALRRCTAAASTFEGLPSTWRRPSVVICQFRVMPCRVLTAGTASVP